MPALFISYRRTDSPDTAKLIHERLKRRLPRWEIFYDHESIPLGEQFPELLRARVASAAVVLVIIGPRWLEILHERIGPAIDHVREEVRLALEATTSIVPILVGHAAMPTGAALAKFPDLQPLLERNGRPVRPDPDFDSDLEQIIAHLKNLDSDEAIGATLADKYTLTAEIAQGGMGVVYRAEQKQPVKRTVAVKLIKPGMDSRDVLARFDAERQALAVMDHPNIARVHDAGMTAQGRPFFVMEYVKGVPITQYCDEKKLSPQERLTLFIPVCNAVQHAHQKGIIHRDLKPSNVLVEVVDGKPVPKIIDFGLAKALGQKLTDQTLYTTLDTRIGTLEYSAPEQAAGRSFDVDTRSDIYSLGVLLYELLTGAPPFSRQELLKVGEEEMRRAIREDEPAKPSKRLSSSGELPAIAANRNLDPNKLTRLVQDDLDWIVMKCLEKENARRYDTASQLGQELQRFLANEPVQAGPPSAAYRLRKFVRRHQAGLLTAAAVLLAVLAAAGGVGWALWDRADRESARRVEVAGRMAETETAVTVAMTKARHSEERAKQLPCTTSAEATASLAEWRAAEASLAEAQAALTTGAAADGLREQVAEARRRIALGRTRAQQKENLFRDLDDARMALATMKRSHFDFSGAAAKYAAAFARYGLEVRAGQTEALAQRIRGEEPAVRDALIGAIDHWAYCAEKPVTADLLAIARAADQDGWRRNYRQAAAKRDGTALVRLSKEARRHTLPPARLQLLALALDKNNQREAARDLLRWARGLHPADFWIAFDLGIYLNQVNAAVSVNLEEQIGCYRVAVALRPDASAAHTALGDALREKKELGEAIEEHKKAIALDPKDAYAHIYLGHALRDKKRLDDAIVEYHKAIGLDPKNGLFRCSLGDALKAKNELNGAMVEYKKAIDLNPKDAYPHFCLGHALRDNKQLDGAIAEYKKAIDLDPKLLSAHIYLGHALHDKNQLDEAIAEYKKAIDLDPKDAYPHFCLGHALRDNKQLDDAIAEYKKAIGLDPKDVWVHIDLGDALRDKKQLDGAIAEYKKAIDLDPKKATPHYSLANGLKAQNRLDAAIAEYKKAVTLYPKDPLFHSGLGNALKAKNELNGAIAEYRKAIDLDPKDASAHIYLGHALHDKDQLDDAIAEYKKAIALDPKDAWFHVDLGDALRDKDQLDDAIAEYKKAIALDPKSASLHYDLGETLLRQSRFVQAEASFRRCLELSSASDPRREETERRMKQARRFLELDKKLPSILSGKAKPTDTAERLDLAKLCQYKQLNVAGARLSKLVLAEKPALSDDPGTGYRYNAVCFAVLAAAGQGKDADKLTEQERADLRKQGLQWLRADLAAWGKQLDGDTEKARPVVRRRMTHWTQDTDLASVRDAKALEKLPPDERDAWQKLWKDVNTLRAKALDKS